jgi:protein-tyrosine phosphatase
MTTPNPAPAMAGLANILAGTTFPSPNAVRQAAPPPLEDDAQSGLGYALRYGRSRIGDHGRLPPMDSMLQITDLVYLGGQINLRGWRKFEEWGVQALVNMRVEYDDRLFGIDTPHYLWLPTIDGTSPSLEQLARGVVFMQQQIAQGRGVYVHCAAGFGRSPSQMIAYLLACGFGVDEATEFVRERRPVISLSPHQTGQIARFGQELQKLRAGG